MSETQYCILGCLLDKQYPNKYRIISRSRLAVLLCHVTLSVASSIQNGKRLMCLQKKPSQVKINSKSFLQKTPP